MRIAVLDDYQHVASTYADWTQVRALGEIDIFDRNLGSVEEAAATLEPYDVICLMRERMPVPASLVARLPNLKLLVTTGVHNRTIDFAATNARGIPVCHTRGGDSLYATSELAWALILAALRHIPQEDRNVRSGGWQQTIGGVLHGKTLGLLGLGRLGAQMVPVAKAFGMSVIAWSPNLTPERAGAAGADYAAKDGFFAGADIISIHMVLSARSKGIVGPAEIAAMRPGALLVNTSRGPLVEETALLAALEQDRIMAALDVYDIEPLPADHPLRGAKNAVLSPHLGYVSDTTYRQFFEDMVENILAWHAGQPVRVLKVDN